MNHHEVNNEFGTHDHEYDTGRYGEKNNLMLRVETFMQDDEMAEARYYLQDSNYERGKCAGEVRGEWHGSRCGNKGKSEYRERFFCGIHFPPKVFEKTIARRVAWRKKFNADWDRSEWQGELSKWHRRAEKILRMIADEETNDPVGLAQMYMDERPKEPTDAEEEDAYTDLAPVGEGDQ